MPQLATKTQSQVRDKARESCELIRSELFEECRSLVDYSYYYAKCMSDYCTWGDGAQQVVCTHAAALARACAIQGVSIPWNTDSKAAVDCCKSDVLTTVCTHSP